MWGPEPTPHVYSGTNVCFLFEIVNVLCKIPASEFIKKMGFYFFVMSFGHFGIMIIPVSQKVFGNVTLLCILWENLCSR